jgi:hypothetical protein
MIGAISLGASEYDERRRIAMMISLLCEIIFVRHAAICVAGIQGDTLIKKSGNYTGR